MRSFGIKFLIIVLTFCLCAPVFPANATESGIAFTVEASGNNFVGGEIKIKITASKPIAALEAIEFTLSYESDYVTPVITENSETKKQMDAFITSIPNGWEQMCSLSSEKEIYNLRFLLAEGNDYLDQNGELVLEIPFKIKTAGCFDFTVSAKDIIAVGKDDALTLYSGTGDVATVSAASDADKIGIKLRGSKNAISNSTYYLDIDAVNLGDSAGIIAFEFCLNYDKNVFSPVITQNTDENLAMDAFIRSAPKNSWEQMCSLNQSEGYYMLRFVAKHCESQTEAEILASGETFAISIPFKVIGAVGKSGGFTVTKASIIAMDNDSTVITGVGDSGNVSVIKGNIINIPTDKYSVTNGIIGGIKGEFKISDFLSDFPNSYITDNKGNPVSEGYIKTDYILTNGVEKYTLSVLGDINGDGVTDKRDYAVLKRFCSGTISLNSSALLSADVNKDNEANKKDYAVLKRHCIGTYNIYE